MQKANEILKVLIFVYVYLFHDNFLKDNIEIKIN